MQKYACHTDGLFNRSSVMKILIFNINLIDNLDLFFYSYLKDNKLSEKAD